MRKQISEILQLNPTVIGPVAHILLDRSYDQGAVSCKECYKSEHWDVMQACVC